MTKPAGQRRSWSYLIDPEALIKWPGASLCALTCIVPLQLAVPHLHLISGDVEDDKADTGARMKGAQNA